MFITPISGLAVTEQLNKAELNPDSGSGTMFRDMLNNAMDLVNATDQVSKEDGYRIATGEADDLHTVMINAEKADLALQLVLQIRNKALDAYNEIMRLTV